MFKDDDKEQLYQTCLATFKVGKVNFLANNVYAYLHVQQTQGNITLLKKSKDFFFKQ